MAHDAAFDIPEEMVRSLFERTQLGLYQGREFPHLQGEHANDWFVAAPVDGDPWLLEHAAAVRADFPLQAMRDALVALGEVEGGLG